MIFGFNTEVKYGDTVYHIQSEVRQKDQLLQTQVFIKGRCVGKHTRSIAECASDPDFSEEHLHQLLKEQHRGFVVAAREGRLEQMLDGQAKPPESVAAAAADPPEEAAAAEPKARRADDSDPLDL
jgi:hypothetical protein